MVDFKSELLQLMGLNRFNGFNGLSRVLDILNLEVSRGGIAKYHALLQFIIALDLYRRGFDVSVEEPVDGGLKADVYAESPEGRVIVEVETGYVPPDRIYSLEDFLRFKIAFKAIAYSAHADLFIVATPSHITLPIPHELLKPIEDRDPLDVAKIKSLAMGYDRARASRIIWRAHLSRVDGVAFVKVSELRVRYELLRDNPVLPP